MTPARPAPRARFGSRIGWVLQARCRFTNPDDLFVRGAAQRDAATICRPCLVATECLADALDNQMEFGVWGGMTERQRRALLRSIRSEFLVGVLRCPTHAPHVRRIGVIGCPPWTSSADPTPRH